MLLPSLLVSLSLMWMSLSLALFAGGADLPLARSGVPTLGGVRGRAVIGDRTRFLGDVLVPLFLL